MIPYELLIFDWDGTLVDSEAQIVSTMQAAIADLNLPPRTGGQIKELIGLGLNDVLQRLFPEFSLEELTPLYRGYVARFVAQGVKEAPLFPGVTEALAGLQARGYRLAVATGKSRKGLDRALEHHQVLRPLFASSRCADETASKPDPLMLRELLHELEVPAERTLMVGDTEYDVHMAAAIGMPALGVACGVHEPGRLLQAGALALIETVRDLPAWLDQ
ncbi:MAG: HAD-IIIA family hydrolase [Gammaproteobacteria bacterium]|nr:HAD-IIIA family hydrolase [Gammaproteobacteria bacterium]